METNMTDHAYKLRQARLGREQIKESVLVTLYILVFLFVYALVSDADYQEEVAKEVAAKHLCSSQQ